LGTRKARQPARKRPVYVNGVYCESLVAGAREASRVVKREVKLWEIQRCLKGAKRIKGIEVVEKTPVKNKPVVRAIKADGVLLRYPQGENMLDRGLPEAWR